MAGVTAGHALATFSFSTTSLPLLQSIEPSDTNNSQLCVERTTPGERTHAHTEEYTEHKREAEQTDGSDRVINRRVQMIKRKETACVCVTCVCVHMSARDLLSE